MSEIRILSADDLDVLAFILAGAYPGLKIVSAEDRTGFQVRCWKFWITSGL